MPMAVIEQLKAERNRVRMQIGGIRNGQQRLGEWNKCESQYFNRFDALLDGSFFGPRWLQETSVANIIADALHGRDEKDYNLIAYSIMPNHVHLICELVGRLSSRPRVKPDTSRAEARLTPLANVLRLIKGSTARESNLVLGRSGSFWQKEGYDHIIHDDDELERTIWYVIENPVKAGLAEKWEEWPWNYCKPELI